MNIDGQCHCGLVTYQAETGDNGRTRFQHFCPECGSPLFTSGEAGPTIGESAGAASASATGSSPRRRSGAAPPRHGP